MALGTVVTLTHTGSVFLLGLITLVASRYILPTSIIPVLEILSGLLIVGLGLYLFRQRFLQWNKTKKQHPTSKRSAIVHSFKPQVQSTQTPLRIEKIERQRHEHAHLHDHGDGHVHSHDLPKSITWGSLVALGVSGGLIPCPDAIAILLVAVAINRIVLGLALIVSFSLGLAVVLVIIGLLMVNGRHLFDHVDAFDRFAPLLPMASALVVVGLGVALTSGAYVQTKGNFHLTATGDGSIKDAQVLYLAGEQDQIKQLFIANADGTNPVPSSNPEDNVVEYAVSPDQTELVYLVQTEGLENQGWLVDLKSKTKTNLLQCNDALCSDRSGHRMENASFMNTLVSREIT